MTIRALLGLVAVVAFIILPNLVAFLIEWLWFGAVGYRAGLCDEPAGAGVALHLHPRLRVRDALRQPVDRDVVHREPVHPHRHERRGHRAAVDDPARADSQDGRHRLPGRVADDRPGRQQRVDALAPVPERRAVRRQRSDPGARHRLLCVPPAAARSDAADRRRHHHRVAHRLCGRLRAGRRAELHEARRRLGRRARRGCTCRSSSRLSSCCSPPARTWRCRICSPM